MVDLKVTRSKVLKAFRLLRKQGFIAKGNFSCCTSCATSELENMAKLEKNIVGWVYWHKQCEKTYQEIGELYLGWGLLEDGDDKAKEVVKKICKALTACGVKYEWDGSLTKKVKVIAC